MKSFLRTHRTTLSRIILVSGALIYLAFGTAFLLFPDIITTLDGIVLPDRPAANHVRAVYGGMEIGLGILLWYFCFARDGVKNGLIVLLCSIGMASLSRLFGIIFDQGGNMSNVLSFAAEFAFAASALILLVIEPRSGQRGGEAQ